MSLDGFVEDDRDSLDSTTPGDDVFPFITDLELMDERRFSRGAIYLRYRAAR